MPVQSMIFPLRLRQLGRPLYADDYVQSRDARWPRPSEIARNPSTATLTQAAGLSADLKAFSAAEPIGYNPASDEAFTSGLALSATCSRALFSAMHYQHRRFGTVQAALPRILRRCSGPPPGFGVKMPNLSSIPNF